ncbi:MAG: hypothetical protein M0C28_44245 [Candidatus Moduliflexus flocculans]|nr:hypothetical protein [Candidatus Moduliflexus flocculans]
MFDVGGFIGKPHKDGGDHIVGHIRNGVDAFGKQGRAVSQHAECGFESGEQDVRSQSEIDCPQAFAVPFVRHTPIVFAGILLCNGRISRFVIRPRREKGSLKADTGGGAGEGGQVVMELWRAGESLWYNSAHVPSSHRSLNSMSIIRNRC